MFGIGMQELAIILVIALLVFGPKRLPELARTLGRGMGEFRRASHDLRQSLALDDLQNELRSATRVHEPPPGQPPRADQPSPPSETGEPDGTPDGAATARRPHPGELPPGDDHVHHDVPESVPESVPEEGPGDGSYGPSDGDPAGGEERGADADGATERDRG